MPINETVLKNKADEILKENFIDNPPIDIYGIAKNEGLEIKVTDFGDKFNYVSGYIKPEIRTIFLNSRDSENRMKFTVAHELGHWLFHEKELKKNPKKYAVMYRIPLGRPQNDPVEREANYFAANILVPEEMFNSRREGKNSEELAKEFNVSPELIKYRISDLDK